MTASGTAIEIANWVQSTQTITTYLPSNRLVAVGTDLTLYPGCDKTMGPGGCQNISTRSISRASLISRGPPPRRSRCSHVPDGRFARQTGRRSAGFATAAIAGIGTRASRNATAACGPGQYMSTAHFRGSVTTR